MENIYIINEQFMEAIDTIMKTNIKNINDTIIQIENKNNKQNIFENVKDDLQSCGLIVEFTNNT